MPYMEYKIDTRAGRSVKTLQKWSPNLRCGQGRNLKGAVFTGYFLCSTHSTPELCRTQRLPGESVYPAPQPMSQQQFSCPGMRSAARLCTGGSRAASHRAIWSPGHLEIQSAEVSQHSANISHPKLNIEAVGMHSMQGGGGGKVNIY